MVRLIERKELRAKLDRRDAFTLVMFMDSWHYEACHIPGSIVIATKEEAFRRLRKDEEIVLYCSDAACFASGAAAQALERAGYTNVWHYKGGLEDWQSAGYPVEGTMVPGRRA